MQSTSLARSAHRAPVIVAWVALAIVVLAAAILLPKPYLLVIYPSIALVMLVHDLMKS